MGSVLLHHPMHKNTVVYYIDILYHAKAAFLAKGPVRWLVLVLVWAGWCWFFVRGKHCWLAETNKRTG